MSDVYEPVDLGKERHVLKKFEGLSSKLRATALDFFANLGV